jgi:hypothetical protein
LLSKNIKIKIHRTTILHVVLFECEGWSLTLSEKKNRMRVFENRVLRKMFGPQRDEVTGEWRRLHNEELYDVYSSPNIIRIIKNEMGGACVSYGSQEGAYRVLVKKPEGKGPLGRPRSRWKDKNKTGLQDV